MATDAQIEQEIQDKGLTAPRVTPADIEAAIAGEFYFTAAGGYNATPCFDPTGHPAEILPAPQSLSLLTFCVLLLHNGFTVTGESACASPENFNAEIGRKIARQNAVAKIWPLLGYELRTKLAYRPEPDLNGPILTEADDQGGDELAEAAQGLIDLLDNYHPIEGSIQMSAQAGLLRQALSKVKGEK